MSNVNGFYADSDYYFGFIKNPDSKEAADERYNKMEETILQTAIPAPQASSSYGTRIYNDKSIYKGNLLNGLRHGIGVQTNADGSKYDGEFQNDVPHGLGSYSIKNQYYVGKFAEGELVSGEAYINNQLTYTGSFETNSIVPEGTYYLSDNRVYQGAFLGTNAHGHGSLLCKISGTVFKGNFDSGTSVGPGELVFSNGSIYVGELNHSFRMPVPQGYGKLIYNQNRTFEGYFEQGLPCRGTLTSSHGSTRSGEFKYLVYPGLKQNQFESTSYEYGMCKAVRQGQSVEGRFNRDSNIYNYNK